MNHAEAVAKLVLESVIPGTMITNLSSRMANAIVNCVAPDGSSGTTLCRSRCMDRFERVLNLANPATVSADDIRRH
jgi:hypothetical protein